MSGITGTTSKVFKTKHIYYLHGSIKTSERPLKLKKVAQINAQRAAQTSQCAQCSALEELIEILIEVLIVSYSTLAYY